MCENPETRKVRKRIEKSIEMLFEHDSQLLECDANERSISHCLAVHLKKHFPRWDVDCEYNRCGHDPKTTRIEPEQTSSADIDARTVYPDIVVHQRESKGNLVAIEIKKSTSSCSSDFDFRKLRSYRKHPLCYRYAVFLEIPTGERERAFPEVNFIQR